MTEAIFNLLEEKKGLFLRYESATQALMECEADSAEQYIIERDALANEMAQVNENIARQCDGHPDKQRLLDAAYARVDFEEVPDEYRNIYYAAQAVRSVGNRILEMDKQVVQRLARFRDDALENIKQNQNVPKIKKYLTDLTEVPGGGALRNEKV